MFPLFAVTSGSVVAALAATHVLTGFVAWLATRLTSKSAAAANPAAGINLTAPAHSASLNALMPLFQAIEKFNGPMILQEAQALYSLVQHYGGFAPLLDSAFNAWLEDRLKNDKAAILSQIATASGVTPRQLADALEGKTSTTAIVPIIALALCLFAGSSAVAAYPSHVNADVIAPQRFYGANQDALPRIETVSERLKVTGEDFNADTLQTQMLAASNQIRAAAGRPPQQLDSRLCQAAQDQAGYMARYHQPRPGRYYSNPTYSHYSNGGPDARLARAGFNWKAYRENLNLCLVGDEQNPWPSWCGSASHYNAILDNNPLAGFGSAMASDGSTYWAAIYATPKSAAANDAKYFTAVVAPDGSVTTDAGASYTPVAAAPVRYAVVNAKRVAYVPFRFVRRLFRGRC
jgi:uncharacterized protein YkwD